jgi:hypothetical protein
MRWRPAVQGFGQPSPSDKAHTSPSSAIVFPAEDGGALDLRDVLLPGSELQPDGAPSSFRSRGRVL